MSDHRWSYDPFDPKAGRKRKGAQGAAGSSPNSSPPLDATKSDPLGPAFLGAASDVALASPAIADSPSRPSPGQPSPSVNADLVFRDQGESNGRTKSPTAPLSAPPQDSLTAPPAPPPAEPAPPDEKPAPAEPRGPLFRSRGSQVALAAVCSTLVHLAAILLLGILVFEPLLLGAATELKALADRPQELQTQEIEERLTPSVELSAVTSSTNMQHGMLEGAIGGVDARPTVDDTAAIGPSTVEIGDFDLTPARGAEWALPSPEGALGEAIAPVAGYDEALDRITQEILNALSRGKVLVVWCFDQSGSMKDDQQEIRSRIEKVYAELGLSPAARNEALLTSVASYGDAFRLHTSKPTSDVEVIRKAIDEVPIDESGIERMCQAVHHSIASHHNIATKGRRQMMLILVTDESGDPADNREQLEAAVDEALSTRCTIYALGREAVFGYRYAHIAWTDPETQIGFNLPVDRGPETPFPEQLQIDGLTVRYDAHPSGFGPYEQARLARETNGVYFMLPGLEANIVRGDNRAYEIERMRPYLPDLRARKQYAADVEKSELRTTIYKIISDLDPYNPDHAPHVALPLTFSIDPQAFADQLVAAQKTAEGFVLYLDAAEKRLERLGSARSEEANARWQANYDLLFAQIISYKVRAYEYGAYLEAFKQSPKLIKNIYGPFKKTNYWGVTTRAETITGELTRSYIERANAMFKAIIEEHPGTPWAARAEYELARGYGIDLVEGYSDPRANNVKLPKL